MFRPASVRTSAKKILLFIPVLIFFAYFSMFLRYGTSKGHFGALLYHTVANKQLFLAEILIDLGADVNFKCSGFDRIHYSRTTLGWAVYQGYDRIAGKLILAGANYNESILNGLYTIIGNAAAGNNTGILELLINKGADVNIRDRMGRTPLMMAVERQAFDAIDLLIRSGADLKATDNQGNTPLKEMLRSQKYAEFLVAHQNLLPKELFPIK